MRSARVSVGTSATLIVDGTIPASAKRATGALVSVPTGGQTVFLGGSDVTQATSYALEAGKEVAISLDGDNALYGLVGATTQIVHVLAFEDA